ncbi:hypothetical protein NHQ30_010250 [Ciborinia camelliae]|nr:hypothetical protein NHQ30_010250 [Ciborinia camelliae]
MHQIRSRVRDIARTPRVLLPLFVLILILFFGTWRIREPSREGFERQIIRQYGSIYGIPKVPAPTINLVIAATSKEDYSWVKKVKIPNLKVLPYIAGLLYPTDIEFIDLTKSSDNSSAPYHTRINKGHEAMIYHQYFYDFYDDLPVSSLNSLDLREVQRRKFLNLRITWGVGCSTVLNTTADEKSPARVPEQWAMQDSFRANFDIYDIPEVLASPCCSQIVVVREVIQAVPKTQYNRHIEWLLKTDLKDAISGRVWEHMWHYLFLHKTIDCPIEHLAYCRLYHICFGGKEAYEEWVGLNKGRESLERELKKLDKADKKDGKGKGDKNSTKGSDRSLESGGIKKAKEETRKSLTEQLETLKEIIRIKKEVAVARGLIEANRDAEGDIETMDANNVIDQKLIA